MIDPLRSPSSRCRARRASLSPLVRGALVVLAASAGAATSGCATAPQAPERQQAAADPREVDVLRERVARLERRLSDVDARLALLVDAGPRRASAAPPREPRAAPPPRQPAEPPPPVDEPAVGIGSRSIDLGPTTPVEDEVADEEGPIIIQMEGDAAPVISRGGERASLGRTRSASRSGGDEPQADVVEDGPPSSDPRGMYDWAMARMREGRHLEAIAAFEDVLERFPSHDLADNALYWTARCHDERGDRRIAIDVWQKLPLRFPKSAKVPDALYGMAQAHEALGEPALAETLYHELVRQHPKAEKAADAKRALARLKPR